MSLVSKVGIYATLMLLAGGLYFYWRATQYDAFGYPVMECLPWQDCPESCAVTPSEEEFIKGAIEGWLGRQSTGASVLLDSGERADGDLVKYESGEEFLAVNPNCCEFHQGSDREDVSPVDLNRQRLHDYYGYVVIKYIRRLKLEDGTLIEADGGHGGALMNSCAVAIP